MPTALLSAREFTARRRFQRRPAVTSSRPPHHQPPRRRRHRRRPRPLPTHRMTPPRPVTAGGRITNPNSEVVGRNRSRCRRSPRAGPTGRTPHSSLARRATRARPRSAAIGSSAPGRHVLARPPSENSTRYWPDRAGDFAREAHGIGAPSGSSAPSRWPADPGRRLRLGNGCSPRTTRWIPRTGRPQPARDHGVSGGRHRRS